MNMATGLDTDDITVRYRYERALWRRAMSGWWQSVVPPAPSSRRAVFWGFVWFGVGIFAIVLGMAGLAPTLVFWCLAGAGLVVGVFGYLQRTRVEQFWDEVGRHWDRAGQTEAAFGPPGIRLSDSVSHRQIGWAGVDAVRAIKGGTVIRSGISMLVIPDALLPPDVSADAFRARLAGWRRV